MLKAHRGRSRTRESKSRTTGIRSRWLERVSRRRPASAEHAGRPAVNVQNDDTWKHRSGSRTGQSNRCSRQHAADVVQSESPAATTRPDHEAAPGYTRLRKRRKWHAPSAVRAGRIQHGATWLQSTSRKSNTTAAEVPSQRQRRRVASGSNTAAAEVLERWNKALRAEVRCKERITPRRNDGPGRRQCSRHRAGTKPTRTG